MTVGNVLDPLDQTIFDLGRATGVTMVVQGFWVYNRPIDFDGLRKFHDHLQLGRLSRRIERSPLRFGRHRWISPHGSSAIEVVASARPREDFGVWLSEQANTRLDCEHGPGWHLAVVPFTDGGTGMSLVISHCLTDGVGLCEALADAAHGRSDPISWPAEASRRRWQALREDARQTVRDVPAMGRAVVAAVRLARRSRHHGKAAGALPTRPPVQPVGADEPITPPTAIVFVDAAKWEARARALGGTSNALLAALAARLAQRVGRIRADGLVALRLPVSERAADDTRANAVSNINITVDPVSATTDLREIRAAIKQALIRHRAVPDEEQAVLTILPLLPKRLVRVGDGSATTTVVSSNLGAINPPACRPDGTDADYFAARILYPGVTNSMVHRLGGLQVLASGRACEHVFVCAIAYQPGRPNSNAGLLQELSRSMNDFSLTGMYL